MLQHIVEVLSFATFICSKRANGPYFLVFVLCIEEPFIVSKFFTYCVRISIKNRAIVSAASVPRSSKAKRRRRRTSKATVRPRCRAVSPTCGPLSLPSIFPTGYIIPAHSPTSPTSTLRATRAHDADLLILTFYRTTLGASSRFTGLFLYPMHMQYLYSCRLYSYS